MRREDSQKKNSWTTADSIRKSPIIPDPSCLDRMERERQEFLEGRGRMLREMNDKYEQTQEVILRRIRSSIQDRDHPSTHNALHHQSTRSFHRSNDICLEPQMKRGGLGHILLKRLREKKACSSLESLSGSDVDPPYMKPFPPSDEPRKRERPHRRVRGLKMAVEQDCSPFRPEDPSPELCTPEHPAFAKPSRLPRPRNLHMLAKKGNKAYFAPGGKLKPRWSLKSKRAAPKAAELAVRQAFKLLQDEEWERKIEGLELVHALAEHHPKVLLSEIDDVCLTVIQEVKNLRSMAAWNATSRSCRGSALNSPSKMEGGCLCSLSPLEMCRSMKTYSPVDWCNLKDLCVFSSICTPVPPPAPKPSRLPRPRSLHMLAKKGNKAYIAPGSKIPRWRGLVRQSRRPEEADTVLRTPVPPPAAAKPSRLPRPKSLHMLAKLGKKACIAPGKFQY
ncbi:uncharacterized protein LOC118802612 [Colossoma macropomum]|uniref:uncharacterized protein LOC118802612 n=1 Tax=Colossoma macropomum TaxID=42526 RepID=UPI001864189D|nr:uncharacterized protein LOC118802612 [Colossoma macropomum]